MKLLTTKLRVSIEYSDIDYYCKSSAISTPLIFTLELDDNYNATKASLKKNHNKKYILDSQELKTIEIIAENDLLWINKIVLSNNLLRFLLYSDADLRGMCYPPESLEDLEANNATIDFGIPFIKYLLPYMFTSNTILINGKTSAQNLYQIKLSITQIRI